LPHGKSPRHQRKEKRGSKPALRKSSEPLAEESREEIRLQKILASAGLASRRGAEEFLRAGRVTVNGNLAQLGDSADPIRDAVALDGERIVADRLVYWLAHKPTGMVTTLSDPEGRPTVRDLIPKNLPRLFPVGRLDLDSSGLVLLTNDGALAHRLLHPSHGNEREYRVTLRGEITEAERLRLTRGIRLEDGYTAPVRIRGVRFDADTQTTTLTMILTEGRKRQIRRSMLALGHPVKRLVRVRMGPLQLGRLPRGEGRMLRAEELEALRRVAAETRPTRERMGRSSASKPKATE
jgi:23S rRNA pseudouridine2605 synthase